MYPSAFPQVQSEKVKFAPRIERVEIDGGLNMNQVGNTRLRSELLLDMIHRRRAVPDALAALKVFPWDSEPLVSVTAADIGAVLRQFLAGAIEASDVEAWADALEPRDDVELATEECVEAIFTLANPTLEGQLNVATARSLLDSLVKDLER
jgi:hypothetical protein